MSDERKKPSAALWCSVVLTVALMAYPLSFGPACWVTSHLNLGADALPAIYQPLTWAMFRSNAVASVLVAYSELLAAPDWRWVFISEAGGKWMPFSLATGMPIDLDDMDAPAAAP
jgi:hypothetical protein